MISKEIQNLIKLLSKLPGLGPRSGRRAALHLMKQKESFLIPLTDALQDVIKKISVCRCGNVDAQSPCSLCSDPKRDGSLLCIVEDVDDLWALERSGCYGGHYHVLGGVLSALDGIGPEELRLKSLMQRLQEKKFQEIILALGATLDGETTLHYVYDQVFPLVNQVTRLSHGVPVGGELEYLDDGTIQRAFKSRHGV